MAEVLLGGKRLNELKVTELKVELDKRGLPKKGVKSMLVQRLKNAILKEALTQPEEEVDGDDEEHDESLLNTSQDESASAVQEGKAQNTSAPATAASSEKAEAADAKREGGACPTAELGDESEKPEEVPDSVAATTAAKDSPVESQAPSAATEESDNKAAAADQESQEIDIEGCGDGADPLDGDIPMELTTPLSSGSELNLSFESELAEEKEHQDKITASSPEITTINKGVDETMDIDVVGEGAAASATAAPRADRVDSVQIDPSFQPESEELLYEGDVENDRDDNKTTSQEVQAGTAAAGAVGSSASAHDEGFVLAVDDTFAADLDVAPSDGKSSPKKQETSSSKTKAEGKGSSKSQSSSNGQSTKGKSESNGSSSSAIAGSSSSNSQAKESGKSSSSGSSEAASSSSSSQCNLWVSGLATSVRALDLQTLFSRYGQVLSAKIVAKSRARPQNRFGYVSMAAADQANVCIKELNGTELKGRKITVEVAKSQKSSEMTACESPSTAPAKETSSSSTSTPAKSPRVSSSKSDQQPSKPEKTSKTPSEKSGGEEKPRDLRRSLDGSSSNKGTKVQLARKSPPVHRRVSSRRSRTPPPNRRRSPISGRRVRSRSRSPPRYGRTGSVSQSRDAREIIRREMEKRSGHGGDPFLRERERQTELRLQERRLAHERQQEMLIRRQLEMEHSRREQELARRMQEANSRETRERELRERQLAERDRQFRERERELREKEFRERQRREALEQELRQRESREKEFRDRERRLKEQHERELREREMKIQREKEIRDREARANLERERELRERETRLKQEQEKLEREHRLYQEEQLKLREQAERERQAALAAKEEAERARINFEREERERRIREKEEHKHQEDERRSKREREQREREQREKRERDEIEKRSQHQTGWLGKRSHQDSGSGGGNSYSSVKRPALHGNSDSYGTVFSRLDPQTQQKKVESNIQPLMSTHVDSFRRPGDHRSGHGSGNVYAKAMSGGLPPGVRSTAGATDLSPELLSAATQALENLRKSVHGVGGQLSLPKPIPHLNVLGAHAQLQQLAASSASAALSAASGAPRIPVSSILPGMTSRSPLDLHQPAGSMLRSPVIGSGGAGSGGIGASAFSSLHSKSSGHYGGVGGGGVGKLPPEEERYNRRFSGGGRSSHHQSGGRPSYKGRMN